MYKNGQHDELSCTSCKLAGHVPLSLASSFSVSIGNYFLSLCHWIFSQLWKRSKWQNGLQICFLQSYCISFLFVQCCRDPFFPYLHVFDSFALSRNFLWLYIVLGFSVTLCCNAAACLSFRLFERKVITFQGNLAAEPPPLFLTSGCVAFWA